MNTEINYSLKQVKPVLDRLLAFINSPEGQAITKAFDKYSQKGISYEIEGKYRLAVYPYGIELFRDGVSIHHSRTVLTGISKMMR